MRTFTVTHIRRPFTRTSDGYTTKSSLPQHFHRRIPFYTQTEDGGYHFHVMSKIQTVSAEEMSELISQDVVIALPYGVQIMETQGLYFGLADSVYLADRNKPVWEEKTYFCALESLRTNEYTSYIASDTLDFYDVLVITHLLKPYEGYPTENDVLRAMTVVTETFTIKQRENRRFGPKRMFISNEDEKWAAWEKEGRIIPLDVPLLFNPGPWNVKGLDLGQSFWTDCTKKHYFGEVPANAKRYFAVYLNHFDTKSHPGYLKRIQMYTSNTTNLDIHQATHMGGNDEYTFDHLEAQVGTRNIIKSPMLICLLSNTMTWSDSDGNVYLANARKPVKGEITFLFHSPEIQNLPLDEHASTLNPMPEMT